MPHPLHRSESEFVDAVNVPVDDEVMIYTWYGGGERPGCVECGQRYTPCHPPRVACPRRPDATLRELVTLVKEVNEGARRPGCRLSLSFVYPDPRGTGAYCMRDAGTVHSTRTGRDDERTLRTLRFQTGDFLDIAVL